MRKKVSTMAVGSPQHTWSCKTTTQVHVNAQIPVSGIFAPTIGLTKITYAINALDAN